MAYVTLEEFAAYLRIDDDVDDAELQFALDAGHAAVDDYAGRSFDLSGSATARTYGDFWYDYSRGMWAVEVDDIGSESSFDCDGWIAFSPRNALTKGRPYERIYLDDIPDADANGLIELEVTAKWGWPSVPSAVKQATLIQSSRFLSRRDAPFGIAGSPETTETRLLSKVDPDVAVLLRSVRRLGSAR